MSKGDVIKNLPIKGLDPPDSINQKHTNQRHAWGNVTFLFYHLIILLPLPNRGGTENRALHEALWASLKMTFIILARQYHFHGSPAK